jgi:hypothetical protein
MSEEALVLTSHPHRSLGPAGYLGVVAIVVVVTILTTATSRLAVQRHLATLA